MTRKQMESASSYASQREGTCISASSRYFNEQSGAEIRRYAHPIEMSKQHRQNGSNCESIQAILCALAGQNQVLCAMKTELDEIYALLRDTMTAAQPPHQPEQAAKPSKETT